MFWLLDIECPNKARAVGIRILVLRGFFVRQPFAHQAPLQGKGRMWPVFTIQNQGPIDTLADVGGIKGPVECRRHDKRVRLIPADGLEAFEGVGRRLTGHATVQGRADRIDV